MKKAKKNFVQIRPISDDEETTTKSSDVDEISDEHGYDSMIENGTDESSDDEQENDDFSEVEEDNLEQTPVPMKRKMNGSSNPEIETKKIKTDLAKPPTVEEINQLKETENLFHSNLFRMQIDEMLNEIKVPVKYEKFMRIWLDNFNGFIEKLKSFKNEKNFDEYKIEMEGKGIKFPVDEFKENQNISFKFLKPTEATLIGSQNIGTNFGPNIKFDVSISMPVLYFKKEDYLNGIYHQKRAMYLCIIGNKLRKEPNFIKEVKFALFKNDPQKPILEIRPRGKLSKITILIHLATHENTFKLNRFVPWTNNVRGESSELLPTPHYNTSILRDLTTKKNEDFLKKSLNSHQSVLDGIKLLKIWLQQRGLDQGICGFSGYIISMYVAYLIQTRKIYTTMSSYQIVRSVLVCLSQSDWNRKGTGVTLFSSKLVPNQPTLDQFHEHFELVFIDVTGFTNICANLQLEMYLRVKLESQIAINFLDDKKINSFQCLFMTKMPFYLQYDQILSVTDEKAILKVLKKHGTESEKLNYSGFWYPHLMKLVLPLISKGLSDRVLSITPIPIADKSWSFDESPSQKLGFSLGLNLNPEEAFNILNKGPSANEPESEDFRQFWGEKSELRRFQDGSITEACIWTSMDASMESKRLICREIISYILNKHLGLKKLDYTANEFDVALKMNKKISLSNEESALKVIRSFDEVCKAIRSLDDLPLEVTSIQGVSPVFRYCELRPILPKGVMGSMGPKKIRAFRGNEVCEGVLQLAVSGKWPNSIEAIRRLKAAFHIHIAKSLKMSQNWSAIGHLNGVDILKDGYVFRLKVTHQKEIALMKQEISTNGILKYRDSPESIEMEKETVILPKITSALHGLYQQFPAFGPTVCLAKRWLYSQLFDSYLWPDECTELLVAQQFIKSEPFSPTTQPQVGFFRFLKLISTTDFKNELILLNFNDETGPEEITEIENRFTTKRESLPALCIVTSYDEEKYGIWSKFAPTEQVLFRVCMLARFTLNAVEEKLLSIDGFSQESLFTPSLQGYNVLIYLKRSRVKTNYLLKTDEFRTGESNSNMNLEYMPPAGLNSVESFLKELREAYDDFAMFFYDPCGGVKIAVLWKPEFLGAKEFKTSTVNGRCLVDDKLQPNIEGIIEDFQILGKGLVESVENLQK